MNHNQEVHRHNVASEAYSLIWDKYEKGALEHKSELNKDFTKEELLEFAIEEVTDLMVYLLTLKEKL